MSPQVRTTDSFISQITARARVALDTASQQALPTHTQPFSLGGETVIMSLSIGCASGRPASIALCCMIIESGKKSIVRSASAWRASGCTEYWIWMSNDSIASRLNQPKSGINVLRIFTPRSSEPRVASAARIAMGACVLGIQS